MAALLAPGANGKRGGCAALDCCLLFASATQESSTQLRTKAEGFSEFKLLLLMFRALTVHN